MSTENNLALDASDSSEGSAGLDILGSTVISEVALAEVAKTPQHAQLLERLGFLESALLSHDPAMPKHLAEIHKLLIGHEELSHLLSEEEIAKIMQAQQIQTNTTLAVAVSASAKKAAKAKLSQLTLSDI